ncbi:MAG TPA: transporter substrate-binding domain-containing protein [Porticoccus sp.]|nr:transporter substrate-binding domain-containing protein [Porticoccus sp.]
MFVLPKYCFIVLLGFFAAFAQADVRPSDKNNAPEKENLIFLFVDYKPLMYRENGKIKGEVGELTMAIFERAGYAVSVLEDVPFRRVFHMLATGVERTCGTGWYKTPERELHANFTRAINVAANTIVVSRRDNRALIESFANVEALLRAPELKTARVNGVSGGAIHDSLLNLTNPNTVVVQRLEQQLRMLSAKRIDYFLAENTYIAHLDAHAPEARNFVSIDLPGLPEGESRYIACSKSTLQKDINRLNLAIDFFEMAKSAQ